MQSTLFAELPKYVATPDGMAIDSEGNLILACPNYADQTLPGCILKIDKNKHIKKWVDVPRHPETGLASPMGIAFGPDGDLYVCDNQGWPGKPELVGRGRILRLRIRDNKVVKTTVVANHMEHPNGMRIRNGYVYVTQSTMLKVRHPSGKLLSAVYRFALDDENIESPTRWMTQIFSLPLLPKISATNMVPTVSNLTATETCSSATLVTGQCIA